MEAQTVIEGIAWVLFALAIIITFLSFRKPLKTKHHE